MSSGEAGVEWGVGGGGGGEVWARIGSLFILSKHLGNASQVWVVGVVRARGGAGTHWQPLNTL